MSHTLTRPVAPRRRRVAEIVTGRIDSTSDSSYSFHASRAKSSRFRAVDGQIADQTFLIPDEVQTPGPGLMFATILQNGDLIWALTVQAGLCLAVFAGLRRVGRQWTVEHLDRLALVTLGLLFGYLLVAWDRVWLSRLLPVANLIVLGNAFPLLTAALAANIACRAAHGPLRRYSVLTMLGLTGILSCCWPLLGTAPECADRWGADGTCLQTTRFTCSAACAATLLRLHGIPATEQEMADLCLTRHGTTWLGLYRGLKKKTADSEWDVEVVECSVDELRQRASQPMILRVGIDRHSLIDSSLIADMGWSPGLRHSVVLRGFIGKGFARISDPSPMVESEVWSEEELRELWQGQAVRFVRRSRVGCAELAF